MIQNQVIYINQEKGTGHLTSTDKDAPHLIMYSWQKL